MEYQGHGLDSLPPSSIGIPVIHTRLIPESEGDTMEEEDVEEEEQQMSARSDPSCGPGGEFPTAHKNICTGTRAGQPPTIDHGTNASRTSSSSKTAALTSSTSMTRSPTTSILGASSLTENRETNEKGDASSKAKDFWKKFILSFLLVANFLSILYTLNFGFNVDIPLPGIEREPPTLSPSRQVSPYIQSSFGTYFKVKLQC